MKHEKYFTDFLSDHVNLNQRKLDTLEKRIKTITGFLKTNLTNYRTYSPQGSYTHKTIIKPVQDNDEFDADLLIFIKDNNFDPDSFETDYVNEIYNIFKEDKTYKDKVSRKTRCVTIDYSGDFHLDIVSCIEYEDTHYICNRKDKKYEKTDGDGYKEWLIDKNKTVGGNNLRKVTRLIKFLRDHKNTFSVKSILLTALLGNEIDSSDKESSSFSDLPTSLKTFAERINDFLQENITMPIIKNPVLPEEDFNRHWNQDKYDNFRDKFDSYNEKIKDAFNEKGHDESVKKWRKLFGEEFGVLESSKKSSERKTISFVPAIAATKPYATND